MTFRLSSSHVERHRSSGESLFRLVLSVEHPFHGALELSESSPLVSTDAGACGASTTLEAEQVGRYRTVTVPVLAKP